MKGTEKILMIVVGSLVGLGLIYLLVNGLILAPLNDVQHQITDVGSNNAKLRTDNNAMMANISEFNRLRQSTIDSVATSATARLKDYIDRAAASAKLNLKQYTCQAVDGGAKAGVYKEVGWVISVTAPLENVVNFMYLLDQEKHLRKLSNLTLTAGQQGSIRLTGTFTTLVLDNPPQVAIDGKRVNFASQPAAPAMLELASLSEPKRAEYEVIVKRDLFRPYVPTPGSPPQPPQPPNNNNPPQPPQPPRTPYDQMIVTSLSAVGDQPEVLISMPGRPLAEIHKIGDKLPVGQIVMVDIRDLPLKEDPKRISTSRVILKKDKEYLAVEIGRPLSQTWVMRTGDLPEELRRTLADSQPAQQ